LHRSRRSTQILTGRAIAGVDVVQDLLELVGETVANVCRYVADPSLDGPLPSRAHPAAKIVVFAQYAETVAMMFRGLTDCCGVAMLTARGARVAGGRLSRSEALARFCPNAQRVTAPRRAERIDLLVTTDLLSEGVNLQDAEVVVHLDLPWTSARLEQRVGRVARMGSLHSAVCTYLIRPPSSAAQLLESEAIVARKWAIARRVVGSRSHAPIPNDIFGEACVAPRNVSGLTEALRAILEAWRRPKAFSNELLLASAAADQAGFVAVAAIEQKTILLVELDGRASADLDSQIAACLIANGSDAESDQPDFVPALARIRSWCESEAASSLAGTADSSAIRRRRLVSRIDSAIENSPPHSRSALVPTAARARRLVSSQQSAAVETELDALSHSTLPTELWLQQIAGLASRAHAGRAHPRNARIELHALLLLRPKLQT
jgi:hypothetical protein